MRRQSSYERYNDFSRSGDRYYDQSRGSSHTGGYGYDRSDSRSSYYDSYHYSNYSNAGSQYDYGRYQYAQPPSFNSYYDQSTTSRSRVDYGDYYGSMYKRYYDSYDGRNPSANAYGYYRESVGTDFRHSSNPSIQRSESGTMITPSFDRYQSSKARLYSFGYRKNARNILTSPKKFSKFDSKFNANKSTLATLQQEVNEEKVEEISPGVESLAKLTLSMINYRFALNLLSLNLTINPEPNEATLFLRNHPEAAKINDATAVLSKEPSSSSVLPTAPCIGDQVNTVAITTSLPPALVPPIAADSYSDKQHNYHQHRDLDVPPSGSKRPVSAVDSARSDFPSSKRLRAQSSEREGMIRDKATTDDYRDHHRDGYPHYTGSQTYSLEEYNRNNHGHGHGHSSTHATTPAAMHRNYSYESSSGGRHNTYNNHHNSSNSHYYDVTMGGASNPNNVSYGSQTSPREYSGQKKESHDGSSAYTPSNQNHHLHQPVHSSSSSVYHSGGKGGDYGIGYATDSGSAYVSRNSSTSRYYDHHYDDRGRDYAGGIPNGNNYSSTYHRENSVSGSQAQNTGYSTDGRDRDSQGDNKAVGYSTSSSSFNMHRQSSNHSVASSSGVNVPGQATSSAASVAGTVSSSKTNDIEEGEYRERFSRQHNTGRSNYSHASHHHHHQQQTGSSYQHYNYNNSNNGGYYSNNPSSTSYPGELSYPTNSNSRGSGANREYYSEYDQRRYASQQAYVPQSSGREHIGGSGNRDYREYNTYRSGHSNSNASNSSTPYQNQHYHQGHGGSAPSSGTRGGGNGTMSTLRTPR